MHCLFTFHICAIARTQCEWTKLRTDRIWSLANIWTFYCFDFSLLSVWLRTSQCWLRQLSRSKCPFCHIRCIYALDIFRTVCSSTIGSSLSLCRTVGQLVQLMLAKRKYFKLLHLSRRRSIIGIWAKTIRTDDSCSSLLLIECRIAITQQTMKNWIAPSLIENRNFLIDYYVFIDVFCVVYLLAFIKITAAQTKQKKLLSLPTNALRDRAVTNQFDLLKCFYGSGTWCTANVYVQQSEANYLRTNIDLNHYNSISKVFYQSAAHRR